MPVRNTEKRIPQIAGFTVNDFGENAATSNSKIVLISFLSSPIAIRRLQNYVLFVTDPAIAPTVDSYEWTFVNGSSSTFNSQIGIAEFTPQNPGQLAITVKVKNGSNAVIATVSMTQQVVALNNALELLIEKDEKTFPVAAHPETTREMVNDLRPYVNDMLPLPANEIYNKVLSALTYSRALELLPKELETPAWRRNIFIEDAAQILNNAPAKFFNATKRGFGVCKTRPQLAALFIQNPATGKAFIDPLIEASASPKKKQVEELEKQINQAFDKLTDDNKIDLFNLLRFPKSHLRIARTILEAIAARYYPGEDISKLFEVKPKALSILTEYEIGLQAFTKELKASPFSEKIFKLLPNLIWTIPVEKLSKPGSPTPGTTPSPGQVGIPEQLPSHMFLADDSTETGFGPLAAGFLAAAESYHRKFGITTARVPSIEKLIQILSGLQGNIARLRLVSHFGGRSMTQPVANGVIFMPFFTNQTDFKGADDPKTFFWHFQYGISDEEGLKALFRDGYLPDQNPGVLSGLKSKSSIFSDERPIYDLIIRSLQNLKDSVLKPFGISTVAPKDATYSLIKWAADLFMLNNCRMQIKDTQPHTPSPMSAAIKTVLRSFFEDKVKSFYKDTGAFAKTNVDNLRDRIAGLSLADIHSDFASLSTLDYTMEVPDVYLANYDAMRAQLALLKPKLNNAFVDVRGCRIGQDKRFMKEFRKFLGNPTVTGPEWYQAFASLMFWNITNEAHLDEVFKSGGGAGGLSVQDIQREYSAWSGRIGINSQLSFWTNLTDAAPFDWLTLKWRTQLPPLAMESVKLQKIITGNFSDAFKLIKQIFNIGGSVSPTDTDLNNFTTTFLPHVSGLQTIQEAVDLLPDQAPEPALTPQLNATQNIANALAQTLTIPSPLKKSDLQKLIDQLKEFLALRSGIKSLIPEIKSRLNDTRVGWRYMMAIGLGLPVQKKDKEKTIVFIYYEAEHDNALKSWYKIHWAKPHPPSLTTAIDGLTTPAELNGVLDYMGVTVDHDFKELAIVPSEEYADHMKKEP